MDFIRAAIKSLFYKYPLGHAAHCLVSSEGNHHFFVALKEVLRWDNPQFTTTEIGVLENVIIETWMKPYKRIFPVEGIPATGKALFTLFYLGNDILDNSIWSRPIVHYDHLLRWRDIV